MFKAIIKFVSEARIELSKVTWPTRKTVINLTIAVVGISLLFSLLIGGFDYLFTTGIKWLTTFSEQPSSNVSLPDINVGDVQTESINLID